VEQLTFLIEARTTFRVTAPTIERALAVFEQWGDLEVDMLVEQFSDVRVIEPAPELVS